jgi:hypothetical protein
MFLTYKMHLMHTFTASMCSIPPRQCCQSPNAGPPFMPASIRSTVQHELPQNNENDYNDLFTSTLAHLFLNNLNINY